VVVGVGVVVFAVVVAVGGVVVVVFALAVGVAGAVVGVVVFALEVGGALAGGVEMNATIMRNGHERLGNKSSRAKSWVRSWSGPHGRSWSWADHSGARLWSWSRSRSWKWGDGG